MNNFNPMRAHLLSTTALATTVHAHLPEGQGQMDMARIVTVCKFIISGMRFEDIPGVGQ